MNRRIIIINGLPRAGKDTTAEFFAQEAKNCTTYNISSIQPVKTACRALGWNGEKTSSWRDIMSGIKGIWVDKVDGAFHWTISKIEKITKDDTSNDNIIFFVHVREPEEIQKLIDYYRSFAVTLLIVNKNIKNIAENSSDSGVFDYDYDYVIDNSGDISNLKKEVNIFIENLNKGI